MSNYHDSLIEYVPRLAAKWKNSENGLRINRSAAELPDSTSWSRARSMSPGGEGWFESWYKLRGGGGGADCPWRAHPGRFYCDVTCVPLYCRDVPIYREFHSRVAELVTKCSENTLLRDAVVRRRILLRCAFPQNFPELTISSLPDIATESLLRLIDVTEWSRYHMSSSNFFPFCHLFVIKLAISRTDTNRSHVSLSDSWIAQKLIIKYMLIFGAIKN